jgi:hypothetical protein
MLGAWCSHIKHSQALGMSCFHVGTSGHMGMELPLGIGVLVVCQNLSFMII